MKPTVTSILQRGYFPKEVPPPFNSFSFGTKYSSVKNEWDKIDKNPTSLLTREVGETEDKFNKRKEKFGKDFKAQYISSICSKYSIAKGKLSRRYIGIPNPMNYMRVTESVVEGWDDIKDIINQSKYTKSKPTYNSELNKRTFTTSSKNVYEFTKAVLDASFDKKVELRLDLANFYSTIYTHSIPWALLGKKEAKTLYSTGWKKLVADGNPEAIKYKKADAIDTYMRNCEAKQTIGIPIGPDASYVIAELISSRLDLYLAEQYKDIITGCRYYDDYYIYTDTVEQAEEILKFMQGKLHEFNLEINESKVSIKKYPFSYEEKFSADLSRFDLTNNFEYSIKLFFNLIWELAEKTPEKTGHIFKYALRIFENRYIDKIKIPVHEWKTFENLILKTVLLDPTILEKVCGILESYESYLNNPESKAKLKRITEIIFNDHVCLRQHLEVSWALWICKKFDLPIQNKHVEEIFRMNDSVSSLILLDIMHNNPTLIEDISIMPVEIKKIEDADNSLFSEEWLLAYEGVKKGWLNKPDLLDNNYFFKILKGHNIEFYDIDPCVNFKSYDYVLTRPELLITPQIKQDAEAKAKEIYEKVMNERVDEIKDPFSIFDDPDLYAYFELSNNPTVNQIKEKLVELYSTDTRWRN
ncbi:MAG: RNA-directed DNA polymerase [Dysgonomonas sp.]